MPAIQSSGREHWLDVVKCLSLIFIVCSHAGIPVPGTIFFYVPVFYLSAGYVFHYRPLHEYLLRKLKRLYLPFAAANLAGILIHNLLALLGIYSRAYSMRELASRALRALTFRTADLLVAPSWFLFSLFLVNLVFYFLYHISKLFGKRADAVLGGLCCGFALAALIGLDSLKMLLWSDSAIAAGVILALPFMYCGWLLKRYDAVNFFFGSMDRQVRSFRRLLFAGGIAVLAWASSWIKAWEYRTVTFSSRWLLYPIALSGCYVVIFLVREILENVRIFVFLSTLSECSVTILLTHIMAFQIVTLIQVYCFGISAEAIPAWPHIVKGAAASPAAAAAGLAIPFFLWKGARAVRLRLRSD